MSQEAGHRDHLRHSRFTGLRKDEAPEHGGES